jgi:hypothetical protein
MMSCLSSRDCLRPRSSITKVSPRIASMAYSKLTLQFIPRVFKCFRQTTTSPTSYSLVLFIIFRADADTPSQVELFQAMLLEVLISSVNWKCLRIVLMMGVVSLKTSALNCRNVSLSAWDLSCLFSWSITPLGKMASMQ